MAAAAPLPRAASAVEGRRGRGGAGPVRGGAFGHPAAVARPRGSGRPAASSTRPAASTLHRIGPPVRGPPECRCRAGGRGAGAAALLGGQSARRSRPGCGPAPRPGTPPGPGSPRRRPWPPRPARRRPDRSRPSERTAPGSDRPTGGPRPPLAGFIRSPREAEPSSTGSVAWLTVDKNDPTACGRPAPSGVVTNSTSAMSANTTAPPATRTLAQMNDPTMARKISAPTLMPHRPGSRRSRRRPGRARRSARGATAGSSRRGRRTGR